MLECVAAVAAADAAPRGSDAPPNFLPPFAHHSMRDVPIEIGAAPREGRIAARARFLLRSTSPEALC